MKRRMARFAFIALLVAGFAWACGEELPTSPITTLDKAEVVVGTGVEALAGDSLTVHYTGWIYDEHTADHHGRQFGTSRGGAGFKFKLGTGAVIQGWDQGVPGMRVGGKRTLIIPPHLAYGRDGQGPVPPNAALIFDIELLQVKKL